MFRVRYLRGAGLDNLPRASSFARPRRTVVYVGKSTRSHQNHLTGEENVIGFDALTITMLEDLVSIVRSAKFMRARPLYDPTLP